MNRSLALFLPSRRPARRDSTTPAAHPGAAERPCRVAASPELSRANPSPGERPSSRLIGTGARLALAGWIVGWLLGLLVGCGPRDADLEPPAGDELKEAAARWRNRANDYVGSDACRECHAEIANRYAGHPMARSLVRVGPETQVETYDQGTPFKGGIGRTYRVEQRGDRVYHVEIGTGGNEVPPFEQAEPVDWAIGSGRRGRSYCIDHDGWLYMSPISWYSTERKWDLSPEYAPESHPRFERPINDRCLHCHAGRLHYRAPPSTELHQRYAEPPILEAPISCERCHGPGGRHVAFHSGRRAAGGLPPTTRPRSPGSTVASPPPATPPDETIVNPARLDAARRDDVCNQCHLSGAAQVLRYGRRHSDFRPGDLVSDIWVTFIDGQGISDEGGTKAVSHVEQMQASQCYLRSAGKLGCTSCHDPHGVPPEAARVEFFNDRCRQCHAAGDCSLPVETRNQPPDSGSCIACHMPRLRADDVPHTTQTDHRIVRQRQTPRGTALEGIQPAETGPPLSPPTAVDPLSGWLVFERDKGSLPTWEEERARGLMEAQLAEQRADAELARRAARRLRPLAERLPDDVDLLDALALCELLDQRPDEAVRLWEQALEQAPERQSALQSLMIHWMNRGETTRAVGYAERLAQVNPWQADSQGRYSLLLARLGRLDEAIEAAERARRLNPSARPATRWLIELYRRTGRAADAQRLESARGPASP